MRVVGIVAHFVPLAAGSRGKSVLSSPGVGDWPRRPVPGANSSGTLLESQAN